MKQEPHTQAGFTLVEMIISLAVFATVATVSVGALLMLIATNEQLQNEQSVMTNLSFALDSMAREIRTGTHYFCEDAPNDIAAHSGGIPNMFNDGTNLDTVIGDTTRDCFDGKSNSNFPLQGVTFKEGGDSITGSDERILYFYDSTLGQILRRVGGGLAQSIVSSGIYVTDAEFFVSGSAVHAAGGNTDQPVVTIYIEAREVNDSSAKPYHIETTITQRTLDI